jgi:hypothetical protein
MGYVDKLVIFIYCRYLEDAYKLEALKHTKLFKHIVVKDLKLVG